MYLLIAALLASLAPQDSACFPCHSTVTFAKGAFPHRIVAHRTAGHCHTCHQGEGNDVTRIEVKACAACHEAGAPQLKAVTPQKDALAKAPLHRLADCAACHQKPLFDPQALSKSVHAKLACADCHRGYSFAGDAKRPDWKPAEKDLISKLYGKSKSPEALAACGRCHESARDDWAGSAHGLWLTEKRPADGAGCLDCHGDPHAIAPAAKGVAAIAARRRAQSDRCVSCHENPDLVKRAGLSSHPAPTYRDSVHGRMVALGNERAPGCASCHGYHDIAPAKSPASAVNAANKVKTCAECHPGATANFAKLFTHEPLSVVSRPGPHYTGVAFSWLTSTVLTLLMMHLTFDLGAELRQWRRRRKGVLSPEPKLTGTAPRFDRHQLVQHWLLIASCLTLVITELPVRFAGVPTSIAIANAFGGVRIAGIVHRVAGVVLGIAGLYHLAYLTVLGVRRKLPFSMVPSLKDLQDLLGNGAYFLGLRQERPHIGRYAYHEKFDYWAVFWGVFIMFGTGLVRWFPVWFSKWLPAAVIEGCQIAHGDEATLAALVLFVWHLYMVHLKPSVFPMQWTWIDGRIDLELLREEHRAEFDQTGPAGGDK